MLLSGRINRHVEVEAPERQRCPSEQIAPAAPSSLAEPESGGRLFPRLKVNPMPEQDSVSDTPACSYAAQRRSAGCGDT